MFTLTQGIASEVNKLGNTLHKEGSRGAAEDAPSTKVVEAEVNTYDQEQEELITAYFNRVFAAFPRCISGGFSTGEDLPREILHHEG